VTAPGKAGHAAVFAEVVKQRRLIRAVLRRYVPACDLDDLEQDVLMAAHRRLGEGGFNPPDPTKPLADSVAAWAAGIAKWTAIESNRARARRNRLFARGPTHANPIDVEAVGVPSPAELFDSKEELGMLERMKMSPTRREVVRLTALGYSAREIGERLGIPEDTAATHLKRARKAWEKALVRWRR
jgi:RNA polymerase sigma factor (sigma-70 family)